MFSCKSIAPLLHCSKKLTLPPSPMTISYFFLLKLFIYPHPLLYLMTLSYMSLKKIQTFDRICLHSAIPKSTPVCTFTHLFFPSASKLTTCALDLFLFVILRTFFVQECPLFSVYSLSRSISYPFNHNKTLL